MSKLEKPRRKNPYERLMDEIITFCRGIKYRHRVPMFQINNPNGTYCLSDLYERTAAAGQLGYDVVVIAENEKIVFQYIKKIDIPWSWE